MPPKRSNTGTPRLLLDPREYLTILGIGLSLAKAGQTAEAGAALDFFVAHAPPARFAGEPVRAARSRVRNATLRSRIRLSCTPLADACYPV